MEHAYQYGMTDDEFWHGDMRLLEIRQRAYYRKISYEKWLEGQYSAIAFSIAISNAFSKKGSSQAKYPEWKDPMTKNSKPKITEDNLEYEFRKQQAEQQNWLFNK